MKRALSGPLQPINEKQNNREGRNIWFELSLAAEWRLRGASVCLDEPDLRLTRDGITILVACKRPATAESVEDTLRGAIRQLRRNLDISPSDTFGVAAISLSSAFNPGDKVSREIYRAWGSLSTENSTATDRICHRSVIRESAAPCSMSRHRVLEKVWTYYGHHSLLRRSCIPPSVRRPSLSMYGR